MITFLTLFYLAGYGWWLALICGERKILFDMWREKNTVGWLVLVAVADLV